jgi:hypothetical protein
MGSNSVGGNVGYHTMSLWLSWEVGIRTSNFNREGRRFGGNLVEANRCPQKRHLFLSLSVTLELPKTSSHKTAHRKDKTSVRTFLRDMDDLL